MSSFSTFLIIMIVLLLGFAGYYYLDEVVPLQTSYEELEQKNQELVLQLEQLERQLEEKAKESDKRNEQLSQLKATYDDLVVSLKEQVERGEITITRIADQLNVKIVDRIIFPSGQAELSPAGIKVLRRVGDILKKTTDRRIKVEGHTDNVPIHRKLRDKFATNWELSVARATHVVRFLQDEVGINATLLEAAGMGEYRPVASNKTRKGRLKNRRIEILLLPSPMVIQKVRKQAARK
ncbi:MAG: OmpA family protein [bacterium]